MITQCRAFLTESLKKAGIKTPVITTEKLLKAYQDPHVGAVLFETDSFKFDGSKRVYRSDQDGRQYKRRKLLARETVFSVIIGDPNPERCEEIFETFLAGLEAGLYIDGNYTPAEALEAEWVDDKDSILKSKLAVNVHVKFIGGVYKDIRLGGLSGLEVEIERGVSTNG